MISSQEHACSVKQALVYSHVIEVYRNAVTKDITDIVTRLMAGLLAVF